MLRATLDINGRKLGTVKITQIKDLGEQRRRYVFHVESSICSDTMGFVEHDRLDGAWALLREVLAEIDRAQTQEG